MILGIDPGLDGAITGIEGGTARVFDLASVPLPFGSGLITRRLSGLGLHAQLAALVGSARGVLVAVEDVRVIPGTTVNNAVQTQASLVHSLGVIEAVLDIFGCRVTRVPPNTWQAFFGLVGKKAERRGPGEMPAATKTARELYPRLAVDLSLVKHHNRAESVLIAHYCLRKLAS